MPRWARIGLAAGSANLVIGLAIIRLASSVEGCPQINPFYAWLAAQLFMPAAAGIAAAVLDADPSGPAWAGLATGCAAVFEMIAAFLTAPWNPSCFGPDDTGAFLAFLFSYGGLFFSPVLVAAAVVLGWIGGQVTRLAIRQRTHR